MNDEMPPQPTTKELPAVPQWAAELTILVKRMAADIGLVSNDLGILKDRVGILEAAKVETENRASRNSAGVRGLSSANLEQDAQLLQEKTAREDLAVKVDALDTKTDAQTLILKELLKLTEKPVVKLIATALGSAILSWLAAKGLR